MAKNEQIFRTQAGRWTSTVVAASNTSIFTPGANGSKILAINTTGSNAAGTYNLNFYDGTDHLILVNISNATNVDVLSLILNLPEDANGNKYFNLENGIEIRIDVGGGLPQAFFTVYAEDY